MKILLILLFVIQAQASFEKSRNLTTKHPVISKIKFKRIIKYMQAEFQFLAEANEESLVIYGDWIDSTADMALARRWDKSAQVLIYRGMAHRREIDEDALILIICHELGHLYGDRPFKRENDRVSVEGQADYFATRSCLRRALSQRSEINLEERIEKSIHNVARFLANNWRVKIPQRSTPDLTVVDETNLEHPHPQCRLDTYIAGLEDGLRPVCWYAK
ncbi:MAG: hypothetical protein BM556_00505 [Bacteriovorax sp. MedPE-SWde]|nr:MAG: hypothetical protein BM556_00505 [Bacteriovorax sp. MedPE-SWde]